MDVTLREISGALVTRLESVPGLGPGHAGAFAGAAKDFVEQCRIAPFAGVAFESAGYSDLTTNNSLAREDLTFRITLVVQDFRGPGFSLESGCALLDPIRDNLMGAELALEGLAPFSLDGIARDNGSGEQGLEVFRLTVRTWRVVVRG